MVMVMIYFASLGQIVVAIGRSGVAVGRERRRSVGGVLDSGGAGAVRRRRRRC